MAEYVLIQRFKHAGNPTGASEIIGVELDPDRDVWESGDTTYVNPQISADGFNTKRVPRELLIVMVPGELPAEIDLSALRQQEGTREGIARVTRPGPLAIAVHGLDPGVAYDGAIYARFG